MPDVLALAAELGSNDTVDGVLPFRKLTLITPKTRFEILKRDRFTCRYCGVTAPTAALHVDHMRPVADGGTDELANLVTACTECNQGKAAVPLTAPAATLNAHHRPGPRRTPTTHEAVDGPPLLVPIEDLYAFGPLSLPVSHFTARALLAVRRMQGAPCSYGALGREWGWKREKVRRFLALVNAEESPLVTAHPTREAAIEALNA